MKNEANCTILAKTIESFRAVLDDIEKSYDELGGEISSMVSPSNNNYVVTVLQEERIDRLTYSLSVGEDCEVKVLDKKVEAIDPKALSQQ